MSDHGARETRSSEQIPSPNEGQRPATFWRRLWEGWKRVAEAIGNFNARVLLTVFYFVFVAPLAYGVKLFSDPLRLRKSSNSYWTPAPEQGNDVAAARRQFS